MQSWKLLKSITLNQFSSGQKMEDFGAIKCENPFQTGQNQE